MIVVLRRSQSLSYMLLWPHSLLISNVVSELQRKRISGSFYLPLPIRTAFFL